MRRPSRYEYLIINYSPGEDPIPIGVLLWDRIERRLHHSFWADWYKLLEKDDLELAAHVSSGLVEEILRAPGEELLRHCEQTFTGVIRLTGRTPLESEDSPDVVLRRLEQQIAGPTVN
jgi:hypothetical protein